MGFGRQGRNQICSFLKNTFWSSMGVGSFLWKGRYLRKKTFWAEGRILLTGTGYVLVGPVWKHRWQLQEGWCSKLRLAPWSTGRCSSP